MTLETIGTYVKRPIRFLHLADIHGWRMKTYGISIHRDRPLSANVARAVSFAAAQLPTPAVQAAITDDKEVCAESRYGIGVIIIHEAREGVFLLISWWVGENMLRHHVFLSPGNEPHDFVSLAPSGIVACVWELAILAFERRAWIDAILNNPNGPDTEQYLASTFSADV
ncbi:hypothetical protein [Nitrincola sp. MINF-07-Sa-05]|uniref:hypothetical protein n=1 Tax=Nitrincola salilacus TaxID=3400273 RepID=UPI003918611D